MPTDEIARLAGETDVALVTLGRDSGEFRDRKREGDFELSATEKAMLQDVATAFHSRQKKLVVVLNVAGVIETVSWRELPDAILLAWQPGQEAGHAITDVLTGRTPPSGKARDHVPAEVGGRALVRELPGQDAPGAGPERPRTVSGPFAGIAPPRCPTTTTSGSATGTSPRRA